MTLTEPLTVWRLTSERHVANAFDGEGARRFGGRWNHPGTPVVYTAATLSLAALELLVHIEVEDVPADRVALAAEIPAGVEVERVGAAGLPADWRSYPAPEWTKDLGTAWVAAGRTAVLEVPSVIVPRENNYLLNPGHPEIERIVVGQASPFAFDQRLIQGG